MTGMGNLGNHSANVSYTKKCRSKSESLCVYCMRVHICMMCLEM